MIFSHDFFHTWSLQLLNSNPTGGINFQRFASSLSIPGNVRYVLYNSRHSVQLKYILHYNLYLVFHIYHLLSLFRVSHQNYMPVDELEN